MSLDWYWLYIHRKIITMGKIQLFTRGKTKNWKRNQGFNIQVSKHNICQQTN